MVGYRGVLQNNVTKLNLKRVFLNIQFEAIRGAGLQ